MYEIKEMIVVKKNWCKERKIKYDITNKFFY